MEKKEVALGASGWWYEVDYQKDLSAALSALRHQVFESGDYMHPWNTPWGQPDAALDEALLGEAAQTPGVELDALRVSMERLKNGEAPLALEHLHALAGPDGTHSILDMFGIGHGFGEVAPLGDDAYERIFGTSTPTLNEVRGRREELMELRSRWEGTAIVAFSEVDSEPERIVFTGFSGD